MKKKVIKEQTYTIKHILYDDNTFEICRINDGMIGLELLGTLSLAQTEIMQQMAGKLKEGAVVKRKVTQD